MVGILIGFFSGIIAGMGIGGGTILIPAAVILLGLQQHEAQVINLITFIPTAIFALIFHARNKFLETKLILTLVLYGILGAIGGSLIALALSPQMLRKVFAVFLLYMGIREFFRKPKKKAQT